MATFFYRDMAYKIDYFIFTIVFLCYSRYIFDQSNCYILAMVDQNKNVASEVIKHDLLLSGKQLR